MTMKSSRTVTVLASLSLAAVGVPGIDTYLLLASTEAAPAHTTANQTVINNPTDTAINQVAVNEVAVADIAPSAPEPATETVAAGTVTAGAVDDTTSAVETLNVPGDTPGAASTPADLPATVLASTTTTLLCEVSLLALRNPRLHRELTLDGSTGYVIAAANTHPWSPASLRCDSTNTNTDGDIDSGTGGTSIGRATNSAGAEVIAASITSNGTLTAINETLLTTDATVLVEGSDVAVDGTGFVPGSTVDIWLHSDPVLLGNVTADSNGAFSTVLTLPTGVELGDHTIRTIGARATEVALALPVRIISNSPVVPAPEPATLTFVDGGVDINYIADQLWLRVNGIWVTRATTEPVELVPGDTLMAQVRNCDDTTCSPWVYSSYTLQVAAAPGIPSHSFTTDDGITGVFTVLSDAEEIKVIVDGVDTPGRQVTVSNSAAIEVLARNCAGLAICSDWVRYDAIISKPATPAVPDIRFVSTGPLAGTLDVTTDADDVEITVNDITVDDLSILASGGDTMTVRARNCDDLCSSWVSADYEVTVADVPDVPTITFTSLTSYTGQLDVDVAADEIEATLNDAVIEPVDVAVVGGDVLNVRARNCDGADVCSAWVDANHVVTVDAAPDPAELTFVSTGPYSGELGYSVTADEVVATFNDVDVTITNFAVAGGEVLRVEARNCDDAEVCSDWVVATHTVSVAPDPDPAGLTYDTGAIKISNDTDVMEIDHNTTGYTLATGAVSWGVDVDDTLDVRVRQCDGFNICSSWVYSNYEVTQADEPDAAEIVFAPLTDITGHLVVTHDADEITMTLDGVAVTGEVVASGHQNLVVQVRDCDGHDVCSEWVESSYKVSVAPSPTAADITFARTTDFAGTLTVTHGAEEETLSLDGDTTVTSPMTVTGLEVLDVQVRNCAGADVCSPWIGATHEVTVAPIPDTPDIGFVTTGDYSRNLDATFTADKSEARLGGTIVTLPVAVTKVSTLVVEAWNCDGYDICSQPASSRDTYTVTVADSPDAAVLTYDNGAINIDSDAEQMEINPNSTEYTLATGTVSRSANVGDTLDVRVRNCDGHDLCAAWVLSTYTVDQAPAADAATFTFTSTGDYSANISISHTAEHVSVTVNGETHTGLTVPVTGGEAISVDVWDCAGFDVCSEPVTSTYNVDVAPTPDPATIDFASTGDYEDSGTLTVTQGDAEEIRQWFNNESTTDSSFTVDGGETLLVEVRNCGTATQICSGWVATAEFVVTVDGAASAAILAFSKVDDDNGTIDVTHAADQIRLVGDDGEITELSDPISIPVTAGQTLLAETRNCLNGRLCSAWTPSTYTVSIASQPAAPTLTFNSTGDYTGTVTINEGDSYDRVEATRDGDSVILDENFAVGVLGNQEVVGRVRGCDDGDLCSPWSSTTYNVTQAASTSTPTFTATRVDGNFDSVSTEITVDFAGAEQFEIYADSTSGTLLSDSSATFTTAKTDGYGSIVVRSRKCAGSDVCSPWVSATMTVTTATNPAQPTIALSESGFNVTAAGNLDRYSLNSEAFVEDSADLTFVAGVANDTLTVETRNCGDVSAFTFCSDVMSVGPVTYVPAPEAAVITFNRQTTSYEVPNQDDYLIEVAFDATHIAIEGSHLNPADERTYTEAEFGAAYPNGIWCKPSTTYPTAMNGCSLDVTVWNESGDYKSAEVPSPTFTLVKAGGVQTDPFTFDFDTETGELLSVVPRLAPNYADAITGLSDGTDTYPGPFTCENDSTCPNAFSNIVGNVYPAGTTFRFTAENWFYGSAMAHIPEIRNVPVHLVASPDPSGTSFGALTAAQSEVAQSFTGTAPTASYTSSGVFNTAYSVDGGATWVALADAAGSVNLQVPNSALYPGDVAVPSLDFRARYCANSSNTARYIYLCTGWDFTKSYTQADLTAANPAAPSLSWDNGNQTIAVSDATNHVEYSTDGTAWSTSPFGSIATAGTYYVRHRNCGTAADDPCDASGQNVFPSGWVSNSYTVTQATQPTVSITVNQSTSEASITTSAGDITYDIDGGTATSYTDPFAVAVGETVNASAVDCSLNLCSTTGTDTLPITQNAAPTATINIDQSTEKASITASAGAIITYNIGSGGVTYTAPFTVGAGTEMTVTAVDCSAVLCSETATVVKTVNQAATPTDLTISINDENGEVTISAPSATTPKITYNTGGDDTTYTGPFTPGDGATVTASVRDCAADLCSTPDTASTTVTYGTTPTVTISMDDSGNLVASTDHAAANTEIRYGWDSSTVTTAYSTPLTTSDYSFGDTLYVQARSIDNADVWSTWTAVQSFNTIAAPPTSAPVIDNNADFSELTFTSPADDVQYQIHTSYDTSTQTAGWTEGTTATIRNGDIDHGDFMYTNGDFLADVSTRARNCANVNVEASCSAWIDELNVTYGTEYVTEVGDSDDGVDTVAAANGQITFRMRFECAHDRCMPISNIQWSYKVDTNPAAGDNTWGYTDTFQIDRANPGAYVTPDATEGEFVANDGSAVLDGQTAHWGTTAVVDTSGTVDLPVEMERIKAIKFSARWAGSPDSTYDEVWVDNVPGFDVNHSW